ncbi:MAG: OmpA family protein [Campylobacterota bacterium]|nr:OmpA family protein [Campylobacterota bacterium]
MKKVLLLLIFTSLLSAMSTDYQPIKGCKSDKDQDGVMDVNDKCPNTPLEMRVDAIGCSNLDKTLDDDGDGVPNMSDKCLTTKEGLNVDESGCCTDCDSDGVLDAKDKCPNTPENFPVDKDGCEYSVDLKINFEVASSQIKQESSPDVEKFAEYMIQYPNYSVEIIGHTSSTGELEDNMILSNNRAEAVRDVLVNSGIESSRMKTSGVGPNSPIGDNDTEEGRAENRRIEVEVNRNIEAKKSPVSEDDSFYMMEE